VISWVGYERGNSERDTHKDSFTDFITDIIVYPEQEELILQEDVEIHIRCPEHKLIRH
jgi:hypothetical protein